MKKYVLKFDDGKYFRGLRTSYISGVEDDETAYPVKTNELIKARQYTKAHAEVISIGLSIRFMEFGLTVDVVAYEDCHEAPRVTTPGTVIDFETGEVLK